MVSEAALPTRSTAEMCVVPRAAGGSATAGAVAIRSRAAAIARSPSSCVAQAAAVEVGRPPRLTRSRLLAQDLDELRHRSRRARRPRRQPVEQLQSVGDEDPAGRRRRVGEELVPVEGGTDRPPADDAVGAQVVAGDRAAARPDVLDEPPAELALVEGRGARSRARTSRVSARSGMTSRSPV